MPHLNLNGKILLEFPCRLLSCKPPSEVIEADLPAEDGSRHMSTAIKKFYGYRNTSCDAQMNICFKGEISGAHLDTDSDATNDKRAVVFQATTLSDSSHVSGGDTSYGQTSQQMIHSSAEDMKINAGDGTGRTQRLSGHRDNAAGGSLANRICLSPQLNRVLDTCHQGSRSQTTW